MKKFGLSILVLAILTACGSGETTHNAEQSIEDELAATAVENASEEEEEMETEVFLLPSPMQIGSIFQNSGLKYVGEVTHKPSASQNYSTKLSKAMNLGVYFADLTYCVLNDQTQEAITHLDAVKTLSDGVGLSAVFGSKDFMERFERNLGDQDSVLSVVIDVQDQMDYYIEEQGMKELEAVIFTGGWIEGMYLGVSARDEMNGKDVTLRLIEQMTILSNLNKTLHSIDSEDAHWNKVKSALVELHTTFDNATKDQDLGSKASLSELAIDDATMKQMMTSISDIRESVINL